MMPNSVEYLTHHTTVQCSILLLKGRQVMTLDIHVASSASDYASNRGVSIYREYKSLKDFEVANNELPFFCKMANNGNHIVVIKRDGWNGSVVGRFDVKRMRTRNYLKLYPIKGDAYAHIKASSIRI